MANEIHSLKIGDVEYPIYSEGIKLDTSASNSDYFLTTSGDSGNKKVGISNAIIGNSTSLSLAADTISIGNGYEGYEPTVIIGDNAGMLYIGSGSTNPVTIHIGAGNDGEAPSNIKMGTPNGSIEIGDSATELRVGNYGTTIGIGNFADEVNIGHMSYGVNIGNQCEGNVVIADGCVWYSEDEDGNEVVEKTTNTYIGENNNVVNIGGGAKTINIGGTTDSATTGYVSIVAGSDDADVHSTIELTPLDYKSLCEWLDSDGESTYQSYMNMESHADTDNIVIGSKYMYGEVVHAQQDIKISNDDFTGIQLYSNYYDGESTASLDINYSGINLSYDYPLETTVSDINMNWEALSLSYNNDRYGVQETIELGTDGTTITASNLKVNTPILEMSVPIGHGDAWAPGNPGIKLYHPNSYGSHGIIMYSDSTNQYIAPISNYSSGSYINLGTVTKRFGYVYTTYGKATNGFTTDSDERLKDFGDDIAVDLDALATLRKSYYRWNETSGFENEKDRMLGMSAQEVQKIYPELVDADENGMLSMAYDRLSVVALAAIDKLHETNKELKAENDELKERLTRLENLVDTILSRIN